MAYHGVHIDRQLCNAGFDLALLSQHANRVLTLAISDSRFWTVRVTSDPSPFRLEADEKVFLPNIQRKVTGPLTGLKIVSEHGVTPVRVSSTLGYRRVRSVHGVPLGDIGAVHGRWWVCAPFAQLSAGTVADFASMHAAPPATPWRSRAWTVSDCQHAADVARNITEARCWHLDASKITDTTDASRLIPYVSGLSSLEPHCLSVSLSVQTSQRTILQLYAAGADAINFPLRRLETARIDAHLEPGQELHQQLAHAVKVMSHGSVSLTMWADAAERDVMHVAMQRLTDLGVIPILICAGPQSIEIEDWLALDAYRRDVMKKTGLDKTLARNFPRAVTEGHPGPGGWHRLRTSWRRLIRLHRHHDSTRPG